MIIFLWKCLPAFLSLLSFSTIAMYALMKKLYAAKFAAIFYGVRLNLYIYIYIYIRKIHRKKLAVHWFTTR